MANFASINAIKMRNMRIIAVVIEVVLSLFTVVYTGYAHPSCSSQSQKHKQSKTSNRNKKADNGMPSLKDYDGIDVSKYQGVINWKMLAKDKRIKFVYIRAVTRQCKVDERYRLNMGQARKVGIKVGSYHFLTSRYSIDRQFKTFLAAAKPSQQNLIPMLDVESGHFNGWSRLQVRDSVAKFCRLVEKHYGCKPMIYSNQNAYNYYLAPHFNEHILYIANYHYYPVIKGEKNHSHNLWQYSDRGHVRGIKGYVDLCKFTNGTQLKDITIPKKNTHKRVSPKQKYKVIYKKAAFVTRGKNKVKGVVLHHTAASLQGSIDVFTGKRAKKASSHVIIDTDGTRYVFAPPTAITWHSGRAVLNGKSDRYNSVNGFTIGIEFQGNTLSGPLTDAQINSAIEYLLPIIRKYHIPLRNITTHKRVRDAWNKKYPKNRAAVKQDITEKEYDRFMKALRKKYKQKRR